MDECRGADKGKEKHQERRNVGLFQGDGRGGGGGCLPAASRGAAGRGLQKGDDALEQQGASELKPGLQQLQRQGTRRALLVHHQQRLGQREARLALCRRLVCHPRLGGRIRGRRPRRRRRRRSTVFFSRASPHAPQLVEPVASRSAPQGFGKQREVGVPQRTLPTRDEDGGHPSKEEEGDRMGAHSRDGGHGAAFFFASLVGGIFSTRRLRQLRPGRRLHRRRRLHPCRQRLHASLHR